MWPFKKREPGQYPTWVYHRVITKTGKQVDFDIKKFRTEDVDGTLYVYGIDDNEQVGYFPGYTGLYQYKHTFYGY